MKKRKLRVSIITPSYNQGEFIHQTLTSILSQSYADVESIVMDGGSTDGTIHILQSFGSRCTWVSKKDGGQSAAINKGLQKCSGDIVAYLNSDDYYLPGTLQTVVRLFENHPEISWVVGDCLIVDQDGREIHKFIREFKKLIRFMYQPWMLGMINPIPQPAVFLRKSAMDEVGKFSESLHYTMDYEYWARFQSRWGVPLWCSQPLAAFRIHVASKGSQHYPKQFAEELKVARKYFSNPLVHSLHKLTVTCILTAYKLLK